MSLKQRTYEGYGVMNCLEVCARHNLTKQNSDLKIENTENLNSRWIVKVKPGFLHTTF